MILTIANSMKSLVILLNPIKKTSNQDKTGSTATQKDWISWERLQTIGANLSGERQESTTHSSQKVQPSSKAKRTKNSSHQEVQSKRGSSVKRRKKSKTKQKG